MCLVSGCTGSPDTTLCAKHQVILENKIAPFLTVMETANLLDVTAPMIYRKIESGRITPNRETSTTFVKPYRIPRKEVVREIARRSPRKSTHYFSNSTNRWMRLLAGPDLIIEPAVEKPHQHQTSIEQWVRRVIDIALSNGGIKGIRLEATPKNQIVLELGS